jgi:hypothetical protein
MSAWYNERKDAKVQLSSEQESRVRPSGLPDISCLPVRLRASCHLTFISDVITGVIAWSGFNSSSFRRRYLKDDGKKFSRHNLKKTVDHANAPPPDKKDANA